MKKLVINIVLVLTFFIIYFLQSNFFTWFNIAGIMPNLFVILVLFIGLFSSKIMGTFYGIIAGFLLDFIIGTKIGIYGIGLGIIGFISGIFDKNFSKDSRMTIMLMVAGATIICEVLSYILNFIFLSTNVEIWSFIKVLAIETIFNLIITIIIYPLIQNAGYYIENEYKGNKILTRYF